MKLPALRNALPACSLAALFAGIAFATSFSTYAPLHAAIVICLYAALATALHYGALWAGRIFMPLGLLAGLAVGSIFVWHVREQFVGDEMRPLVFAALAASCGVAYFVAWVRGRSEGSTIALAGVAIGSATIFVGLTVGSWFGSNTLRWHLLHQNRLIGTPAYYAFAPSIDGVRSEWWSSHVGAVVAPARVKPEPLVAAPDVVFLLVDTLRADALSAYGGGGELMPRLDQFAERSWVFDDVLANATWTRASVASYFTGLAQEQHGAVDRADRLPQARYTLAERLADRGYATAAFVSNFGAVGVDAGFDQGFEHFEELQSSADPYARAPEVNRAAERWLAARPPGDARPVFLYLHYLDPHTPYLSGAASGQARDGYDRELRYLDDELMDFVDRLPQLMGKPPVLFVTSDHGEEFGEHGDGGHGHSLYPEVAHLPSLLRLPAGGSGHVAARLEARDFFDLLAGAAIEGADIEQWAAQRARARRYASIYSSTSFGAHRPYKSAVGIRGFEEDGWFLLDSAYGPTFELYERSEDPALQRNVAALHPERVAHLRRALEEHLPEWVTRQPVEHSDETEALLQALGYIEGEER